MAKKRLPYWLWKKIRSRGWARPSRYYRAGRKAYRTLSTSGKTMFWGILIGIAFVAFFIGFTGGDKNTAIKNTGMDVRG